MQKPRILIIDEDVKFSNILTRMLTLEGYNISRAFDFDTSLEIMKGNSIDIVLMDAEFKEKGSPNYTRFIKDTFPDINIIILSSHPDIRN